MNNTIANFLVKLKNSSLVNKETLNIRLENVILKIVKILYKEGFIQSFTVNFETKNILIYLRYSFNKSVFNNVKIISLPSKLLYVKYKELTTISSKNNFILVSTTEGFKTFLECKKSHLGGKILFLC
jgi:small subunit ribosomal protein S8